MMRWMVALGVLGALLILVLPVVLVSILARAEAEREYQARLAELEAAGLAVGWEAVTDLYGQVPSDENAALAAERYRYDHGALPASLEALVPENLNELSPDPLTGDPLEYRTDESWRIVTSPAIITDRLGPPRFQLPAER